MTLKLKPGVRLHPTYAMAALLLATDECFRPHDVVVTSGMDGKHMQGSLHYRGLALDFRTNHVPSGELDRIVTEMKQALGPDFDIVLESDHLHAEYDPKGA